MIGRYTYCMRNGHDWSRQILNEPGISIVECAICGARQVRM